MNKKDLTGSKKQFYEGYLFYLILFLLAFFLRFIYLLEIKDTHFFNILVLDAKSYSDWAKEIAGGHWLGTEIFYQAPLYPYFMGLIYKIFGENVFVIKFIQILLGSSACLFIAKAGENFFSKTAGRISGVLLAVYPVAIFFDALIQKAGLVLFLFSWFLYLISSLNIKVKNRNILLSGMVPGFLSLTRENSLVFIPLIMIWLLLYFESCPLKKRFLMVAVFSAGLLMVLFPVSVRNKVVGGEFHITTSQFGPNFFIGNNANANGIYKPLKEKRSDPLYERKDAVDLAEKALGRRLTPGEVSDFWFKRGLGDIKNDVSGWIALMFKKLLLSWNRAEVIDGEGIETYSDHSFMLKILFFMFHFGILAPLGLIGIILNMQHLKKNYILHLFLALITISVALFYIFARYRYPLVPVLILFSGAGIVEFAELIRHRSYKRLVFVAGIVLFFGLLTNWSVKNIVASIETGDTKRVLSLLNYGKMLQQEKKYKESIDCFKKALHIDPDNSEALYHLGDNYYNLGDYSGAEKAFKKAIAISPEFAKPYSGLGLVYYNQKLFDQAHTCFTKAVELDNTLVETHYNLGLIAYIRGDYQEAENAFKKTIHIKSDHDRAINNLGLLYRKKGFLQEALHAFDKAIHINPDNYMAYNNLGIIYQESGIPDRAELAFSKSLEMNPGYVDARNNLGLLFYRQNRLNEAEAVFKETVGMAPNHAEAHYNLGLVYGKQKKPEQAIREWQKVLEIDPNHARAHNNIKVAQKMLQQ